MKKELLLTLMALTVSVFSWAQKVCSIEGVNYRSTSDKTASVSKSEKASGEVVIYNEVQIDGKNYEVTTIDDEAFRNCKEMVAITIPNSVTSIGKSAFLGCDGLKEVLLHKGGVDRWNKGIVKFADKYSNPVVITKTLSEIVKTEVKFTAPEIIKDDEPEGERKALVRFNTTWFEIDSHMDIPESQEAQQYLAELLFDEKGVDMKEAYDRFLKLWNHEERNITKTFGKISFDINKEYEQEGRFACYHVKASLKGNAMLTGLPQTKSAEKQKAQYFKLVKGIDNRFIVDTKEQKIAGVDQIFVPGIAEKIKQTFGADVNLYAEDRCLQLLSKVGDGRFIFSKTSERNFTDYFKQLVGWYELQDIDTPEYLHGQKGVEDYLKNAKFILASNDEKEVDVIKVSMVILEDGSAKQPTVEGETKYCNVEKLIETLGKMPKWKPAYKDGAPIAKEIMFDVRVPRWVGVADQMPTFPGGQAELIKFLSENLKYPKECEVNGIQGRVVCSFVVEEDGSISSLRVVRPIHPLLDKEAIRVLSKMPKWKPGMIKGQVVRVKYTTPLSFRLQ